MRVNPFLDARLHGGQKTFAVQPRRIEKISAASGLGTQHRSDDHSQAKTPPRLQVELVYQDDTARTDPFRDAPRLLPTFVTQLLGQVMPKVRESISVETAYGKAAPRLNGAYAPKMALLFDRKS
jgi:hypothetical protein